MAAETSWGSVPWPPAALVLLEEEDPCPYRLGFGRGRWRGWPSLGLAVLLLVMGTDDPSITEAGMRRFATCLMR